LDLFSGNAVELVLALLGGGEGLFYGLNFLGFS
jgi:hypothetical protein